jgi:hypothetical protein
MGLAKDQKQEKQQRRRRGNQNTGGAPASWMLVDAEQLVYVIAAVAQKGGALRLGYTRDGGAFAIGIYGDGDPYTEYVSPKEDMSEYLRNLASDFGNVTGDGSFVGTGGK